MTSKTRRVYKGERQALFGGYVSWESRGGRTRTKEVRVWGPAGIDETDCGAGTKAVVALIAAKANKPANAVRECWRYS